MKQTTKLPAWQMPCHKSAPATGVKPLGALCLSLCLSLCLAACLALAAVSSKALACIGEIPGFPREIKRDKDKSSLVDGVPVRVIDVIGEAWLVPDPVGFSDLELKQRFQLECWEETAAYNLRDANLVYFAAAGSGLPEFSQAHIHINDDQLSAEHNADFKLIAETAPDDPDVSKALGKYLADGTPISAQIFAKAVANAPSSRPYAVFEKDGLKILVRISIVEGRITPADAKAKEEMWKNLEKGPVQNPDGSVTTPDMPPVGDGNVSFYPCVNASLVFKNGGKYISMLVQYGPLENQNQIDGVVNTLLVWKTNFEKLNP